jgi:hypothetical protein
MLVGKVNVTFEGLLLSNIKNKTQTTADFLDVFRS